MSLERFRRISLISKELCGYSKDYEEDRRDYVIIDKLHKSPLTTTGPLFIIIPFSHIVDRNIYNQLTLHPTNSVRDTCDTSDTDLADLYGEVLRQQDKPHRCLYLFEHGPPVSLSVFYIYIRNLINEKNVMRMRVILRNHQKPEQPRTHSQTLMNASLDQLSLIH